MNGQSSEETRKLSQWVASIAITVVCCALFFLFFAGYFLRTQEKLIEMQVRSEMQEARMNMLENNLLMLGQRTVVQNIVPAATVPAPVAIPPAVQAPSAPVQPTVAPPAEKPRSAAPPLMETVGGDALLLNTVSVIPDEPLSEKRPADAMVAPKPKPKPDAKE